MSERPTPETDAEWDKYITYPYTHGAGDLRILLQRLERERDEAMELLASEKITRNHIIKRSAEVERERDEAREALSEWENAAVHVEADHPDEKHCGCVSVLRKLLADARSERDEAREDLQEIREYGTEEINAAVELRQKLATALVDLAEAREALREIWQSGDAFLPHVDQETTSRWRKAAGWEEAK